MNTITDTKRINLSPKGSDIKINSSLNSNLNFYIPKLVRKDKNILYNTIKVIHCEFPYSFYIVNEYNNILALSTGIITLGYGNYNANTFITAMQALMPTDMILTFDSINGKYTITYNQFFSILSTSTCYNLMGFDSDLQYDSTDNIITILFPCNFLGSKNLYLKCPNIILENYNTTTKDYSTLLTIPINVPPFGFIIYENKTNSRNLIKNH